jgi:serine/threonine-protein kinase RsbW
MEPMTADHPPFSLTIPSDSRMLSVVRAFVEAVCQTENMDRATTHAIILATGEAVTNIIRHAHHSCPEIPVHVCCRLDVETIEILLLDEGEPFDLDAVPRLDPGELRVGGRGVFLMRALMDELSCQARAGRGNALRMVKHWRATSPVRECG